MANLQISLDEQQAKFLQQYTFAAAHQPQTNSEIDLEDDDDDIEFDEQHANVLPAHSIFQQDSLAVASSSNGTSSFCLPTSAGDGGGSNEGGDGKKKRPRTAFTTVQIKALESEFDKCKYLSVTKRVELSRKLGLTQQQLKVWYQNRRTKWKRKYAQDVESIAKQYYTSIGLNTTLRPMFIGDRLWLFNYLTGLPVAGMPPLPPAQQQEASALLSAAAARSPILLQQQQHLISGVSPCPMPPALSTSADFSKLHGGSFPLIHVAADKSEINAKAPTISRASSPQLCRPKRPPSSVNANDGAALFDHSLLQDRPSMNNAAGFVYRPTAVKAANCNHVRKHDLNLKAATPESNAHCQNSLQTNCRQLPRDSSVVEHRLNVANHKRCCSPDDNVSYSEYPNHSVSLLSKHSRQPDTSVLQRESSGASFTNYSHSHRNFTAANTSATAHTTCTFSPHINTLFPAVPAQTVVPSSINHAYNLAAHEDLRRTPSSTAAGLDGMAAMQAMLAAILRAGNSYSSTSATFNNIIEFPPTL